MNQQSRETLKSEISESTLMGIQSITDLRMNSKDKIRQNIQDFISHKTGSKGEVYSQLNLKSFYIGKYKNPELVSKAEASYESLNIKDFYSKTKFGSFHKLYQRNNKYSTLYNEPLFSGCCSPADNHQNGDANQGVRFMPKDSHENLDKLNLDMASKVKLISRNNVDQK